MNLSQLKICVQRFHHVPSNDKEVQAVFLKNVWWDIGSELTVSMSVQDPVPKWVDIPQRNTDLQLEQYIRTLSPDQAFQYLVTSVIQPLVPVLRIKFVPTGGMIRVRFYGNGGSSSLVGTQSLSAPLDQHTLTLGWLDAGTMLHEFCHALGMLHEHQNPRGQPIQWNMPVVYEWAQETQGWDKDTTYHNIIERYSQDQTNGSIFDPNSIMLYFYDPSLTTNHQGTRENHQLSETDKKWLSLVYPAQPPRGSLTNDTTLVSSPPSSWNWILVIIIVVGVLWLALK